MLKLVDKGFLKDDLIGMFELDLSFIYLRDQHALLHQILALSNPNSENFADIAAYMKVSVQITAAGDEQIHMEMDQSIEENQDIMMSPSLQPIYYQLKVRIFKGTDLPMMDQKIGFLGTSKIDAYIKTQFRGKKYKT